MLVGPADQPLPTDLPHAFPMPYHHAWRRYPIWGAGVPDELFISTDGSGLGQGGSAFAVWAFCRQGWYRVGWFADALPRLQWAHLPEEPAVGRLSFHSELVALQSAGLWVAAMIDHWALYTRAQPKRITIAVDNAAALQVAAGHANPLDSVARWCRHCWQAVQARCSTTFRHVHGHQGIFVNTIVDALAGATARGLSSPDLTQAATRISAEGPWLWMMPQARFKAGQPLFQFHAAAPRVPVEQLAGDPNTPSFHLEPRAQQPPLQLHLLTAIMSNLLRTPGLILSICQDTRPGVNTSTSSFTTVG